MPKALITGINGFVGTHLNNYLNEKGFEVFGTIKPGGDNSSDPHLKAVDILNFEGIRNYIQEVWPDYIYHLAALVSPSESFKNPQETITNNIGGQVNILQAVTELNLLQTKILVVSSAEVYGAVDEKHLPINEDAPLKPRSPYAVTKIAQDFLGLQYFLSQQLQCIRVRPFNHIGPYQAPHFAVPSFAKQIAEIEKGKKEAVLRVGNLEAKRDFTDVRDVVRAYGLLMEKGEIGDVYNIGFGKSYKIEDVLNQLLLLSDQKIIIEKDPSLVRPADIPELLCDYSKLNRATGWKPEISLATSLKDTLDYWRNIV